LISYDIKALRAGCALAQVE